MLIGTKNVSDYSARQARVTIGNLSVKNNSEWVRGSPSPVLLGNALGMKTIKIDLVVKGGSREATCQNVSNILALLLEPVDLKLDGFTHRFKAILTRHSHEETVMRRWHVLTLEFSGYEYGTLVTQAVSGAESITVNNTGNIATPAIVEITPQIGVASITLTGICRDSELGTDLPVTIRELTTGKKITLNGETGLMTEAGKLKTADLDIWELPTLTPGNNTITISSNRMDITVKYHPRYM